MVVVSIGIIFVPGSGFVTGICYTVVFKSLNMLSGCVMTIVLSVIIATALIFFDMRKPFIRDSSSSVIIRCNLEGMLE